MTVWPKGADFGWPEESGVRRVGMTRQILRREVNETNLSLTAFRGLWFVVAVKRTPMIPCT